MRETPVEHDVGLEERVQVRAVVVLHRELDRLDAAEVVVGEAVQQAGRERGAACKWLRDRADQRAEQVDASATPRAAAVLAQRPREVLGRRA